MENKIILRDLTKENFWKGCMLSSIAHAIMVAHYPEVSHEQSWDGINYSLQDSSGTKGTITFHPQYCIAAFRNDNSERCRRNNLRNAESYFKGSSPELIKLARDEALQYLLENVDGRLIPIITTAFWGTNEEFFSTDFIEDVYENGGFLIERQIMEIEAAVESWEEYYDMSGKQIDLLMSIFKRKIANPQQTYTLSKQEIDMIECDDINGLVESKNSFKEIGIYFE